MILLIKLLFALLFCASPNPQNSSRVIVQVSFKDASWKPDTSISWSEFDYISNKPLWKKIESESVKNETVKWIIPAKKPLILQGKIFPEGNLNTIFEPGDSILIDVHRGESFISGKGSQKINLLRELDRHLKSLPLPQNKQYYYTYSVADLMEWHNYINQKESIVDKALEGSSGKLSMFALNFIRSKYYSAMEADRLFKFQAAFTGKDKLELSSGELCRLYDSITGGKELLWLRKDHATSAQPIFQYNYAVFSIYRDLGFDRIKIADFNRSETRVDMIVQKGAELYQSGIRENFYAYIFTTIGIKEHSMEPAFERLLRRYYLSSGLSRYKDFVKDYERKYAVQNLVKGNATPLLMLRNDKGNLFSSEQLKGKPSLLFFRKLEDDDCKKTATTIKQLAEDNKWNELLNIVNISVENDKLKWLRDLEHGKHVAKQSINLITGDDATQQYLFKGYQITTLPALFFLSSEGKIISHHFVSPHIDQGESLRRLVSHQQALLYDGPYIIHEKDSIKAYSFRDSVMSINTRKLSDTITYYSMTDLVHKTIHFKLKNEHKNEPSNFERPEKLFALSDIEGNFDSFRKLLQNNGIIDEDFNWIFGKGHLVFAGDMFDRGDQVTECLWLTYLLEQKAKLAGGYVHFVMGNHEIMNLSGDLRYVRQKYLKNAHQLKQSYNELFNVSAELGKWLRTKNIMVKIGDLLFLHAGVSDTINKLSISIDQINSLARTYYSRQQEAWDSTGSVINKIFMPKTSPFWFRLYYKRDPSVKAPISTIDGTLAKFGVKHIITGHTVIADTISAHYNNKVINTDTKHAKGKSEALLIEGRNFYRVNAEGKRVLLFKEDKK